MAQPAAHLVLIQHEAAAPLGMGAMEMMAVLADPATLEGAKLQPGDRVRLAVRPQGDEIRLVWVEKLP